MPKGTLSCKRRLLPQSSFAWRRGGDSNPCAIARKLISSVMEKKILEIVSRLSSPLKSETTRIHFAESSDQSVENP